MNPTSHSSEPFPSRPGGFPTVRPRRLRHHPLVRSLVRETTLTVDDLILPLFVRPGQGIKKEIASMPGNYQLSLDRLLEEVGASLDLGVHAFILFGIPTHKDATGSSALDPDGIVQQALRALRKQYGDRALLMTDECFCEYTDHGHCGVLSESTGRLDLDNDATLPLLAKQCVSHVQAGADLVAPSGMLDGMVGTIRAALDAAGFSHVPIVSYAAKYASGFYGPFRDAAESPPQFGDRNSYQMDPANGDEALREVELDLAEGADIIMVKPALAYLDIIRRVKERFAVPVAAYNVSGEFAMVKAAAQKGWIDERRVALEILTGIKRAGADMILTYFARDAGAIMLVGQQLGQFTIDKELGSGAMGTVYRGRYTKTGQIMAIKVMAPGFGSTNAAAGDRFEREIAVLKQLNHPSIVRFYGAGKQQGMRYFAMEYIEGESLDHVMSRRGRMTWEEVVALGQQLCSALQHAHEKGIIHRDLKPSNIMVLPDGTLKLTDFGIAKATELEALTQTNCTVGTAAYMSPEQCKGQRDLTSKSDLYSLGVLFYELLTGKKPFKADNAMEMFVQHVKGTFERPSRLVFDIPVWLDTLVCQLLEKEPDKRPLDANMVAGTLGSIQEKIEAQQSAGVEAVRRRLIDRSAGAKRLGEEDKEAARVLLTGKGRAKRKQTKKRFYQRVWFQAAGLLLALSVVGTLLYLVFRAPSADKLYQQAQQAWQSSDPDVRDQAIESNGAIRRYIKEYGGRNDDRAKEVSGWDKQIQVEQKERLIDKYLQKLRRSRTFEAQDKAEEAAFAAAKAEDEGERDKAVKRWQQVKQDGSTAWGLTADRHLDDLNRLDQMDKQFEKLHQQIRITGKDEPLADPLQQQAFLSWRAKHSLVEDSELALKLLKELKDNTIDNPPAHFLYLYATCNGKRWADAKQDKKKVEVEEDARAKLQGDTLQNPDKLLLCLDILALYEKDKDMAALVQEADKLRDKLQSQ